MNILPVSDAIQPYCNCVINLAVGWGSVPTFTCTYRHILWLLSTLAAVDLRGHQGKAHVLGLEL